MSETRLSIRDESPPSEDTSTPSQSITKDAAKSIHAENLESALPAVHSEEEALRIAKEEHDVADHFIAQMDQELEATGQKKSFTHIAFKNPKHFTWVMMAFASMGGMLFGLDQSLISGANLFMPDDLGFSARQVSLVNAGLPLGAVAGAVVLSPANEMFGRRGAIILATILYTLGAGLEAGAISFPMMVIARLIVGFGVGIETGTVPIYVAESVERRLRGNLVSLYQFNVALGEVLGFVVAAIFLKVPGNWRYMLGSSVVFSIVMGVGMVFLPESPRFLMHKGRTLDAYRVWRRIRGVSTYESRSEFFVMKAVVDEEIRNVQSQGAGKRFVWMDLFTKPRARRAFVYANIMVLLGEFVGITGIMYYMSTLMNQVGFDPTSATYMSMVGGGALLLGTIPAVFLMERCGRRFWAMTTLPGFFVGLILVGMSYLVNVKTNAAEAQGLYLTGLIIYMGFFGPYACLTWVIPAEVYPLYLRSYGMTSSDALVFLGSFVITYNFTGMQEAMTKTGLALGFFGGIATLGWFYQIFFMPETKDLTLEEIDQVFSKPTKQLVAENIANTRKTVHHLMRFQFKEAFLAFGTSREE